MGAIEVFWEERKATSAEDLAQGLSNEDGVVATAFSRSMREAASWTLAAEMVRRNPGRLFITTSVPIEGVPYDCLRLCRLDLGAWVDINRFTTGSANRWTSSAPGDAPTWLGLLSQWMSTDDRAAMADAVERWLELPAPFPCDPAPARDLTYRVIAAFLAARSFDQERWSVRGLCDEGSLHLDEDIASVLGLRSHVPGPVPVAALPTLREANVFAICRDGAPVASITTDAVVTPIGGDPIVLKRARRGGLAPTVAALARALG